MNSARNPHEQEAVVDELEAIAMAGERRTRRTREVAKQDDATESRLSVDAPDEVTVCWSEEKFQPVQFNGFGVGPFFMKTKVRPGETAEQALARAYATLEGFARTTYPRKRDAYLANLNDAVRQGRAQKVGR